MFKVCNGCQKRKPATTKFFRKQSSTKDGLKTVCKECTSACDKKYKEKNKEKIKKYYQDNKSFFNSYGKEYRDANKERCLSLAKKWKDRNREANRARAAQYRKDNPEISIKSTQARMARIRSLPATLTVEQWEAIKREFNYACAYCGKKKKLCQEHFVPLVNGGEYTHNNILPSCTSCNTRKGRKSFSDWYHTDKYYSKKREQKILRFLCITEHGQQLKIII